MISFLLGGLLNARRMAREERRRGDLARSVAVTALAGVGSALRVLIVVGMCVSLWLSGLAILAVPALLFGSLILFPELLLDWLVVPLGAVRAAHAIADAGAWSRVDRHGAAVLAAARALVRRPSSDAIAWIEAKRDRAGRLGDCAIAATALCAAARGDRDGARALLESLARFPEVTPVAREAASEWLAADDAERGHWRRLLERAPRRLHAQLSVDGEALGLPPGIPQVKRRAAPWLVWPGTPLVFFLEGVAARLLGKHDAPGDAALFVRWLEAPRRRHTWSLYRRAIAAAPAKPQDTAPEAPAPAASGDLLAAAIGAHVAAIGAPDVARLRAAATAWDAALGSSEIRTNVLSRAIDVGAPPDAGHRVLDELARTAADELAQAMIAAGIAVDELPRGSATLDAAAHHVRHLVLDELELAVSRTGDRARRKTPLPAIDEWREVASLYAVYRRAARLGGDDVRRLAFPHTHGDLTPWLVWLWNDRGEHGISGALTTWLLAEALAVGDAQAIETHAKNATLPLPRR